MNDRCEILCHEVLQGPYRRIVFHAPEIAKTAKPGQFVHVRILPLRDRILRRPFSICSADPEKGSLTVVYKIVGEGTDVLSTMKPGDVCEILGPQGNSYSMPKDDEKIYPILVAGGYGSASTFFLAERLKQKGAFLTGARSGADLLLIEEYRKLGFDVRISTNDGSVGHQGFVTDLLAHTLREAGDRKPVIYACGPEPMLIALGKLALTLGVECELSLDQRMGCGVGACFACVIKVNDKTNADGWRYSRSCKEGPVYNAKEVYLG